MPFSVPDRYRQGLFLASIVLLAFVLRMIVVLGVFRAISAPSLDHNEFGWEMGWTARSIALGQGFSSPFLPVTGPTALMPPLYPYLLAGIFKLWGLYTAKAAIVALSFNALLSALTVIPVFYSTKHALHLRAAKFAAIAWTLYPFSIYFAADRVWDYALTALLLSLCFWTAQKLHLRNTWAWLGFGWLCGIATLSNPSVLTVLSFLVVIALLKVRRVDGPWIAKGALLAVAFALVCLPWTLHNRPVTHTPFTIRDGFWLEFYAGNNGDTFESNPDWAHPASNPVEMTKYETMGEFAYMAQKQALAIDFVKHHPLFTAGVSVRRAVRFWTGYWSFSSRYLHDEPLDVPCFFFCTALTLFMLRGLHRWWAEDRGSALPYLLAVIMFPLTYYVTHSSMDYRQPIEPLVTVLVVVGIFGLQESRAESPVPERSEVYFESSEDEIAAIAV